MPHLWLTALLAVLLTVAMAGLGQRSVRARLYVAIYLFFCFVVTTVTGSWIMYLIHG